MQAVAVEEDYAYVGMGSRLVVLDISDPAALYEVGSSKPFSSAVESITLSSETAYVTAGGAGLYIVDISDPTRPAIVARYDTSGYAEDVKYSFIHNPGTDGGNNNQWDDGSEGNYWSGYPGKDADGDGIGDTSYVIPSNGVDNYPLMMPFSISFLPTKRWR